MKYGTLYTPVVLMFFLLLMQTESNSQYAIPRSVLGSGGVQIGNSGNRIIGTVGQAVIGAAQNTGNKAFFGFWYAKENISTDAAGITAAQDMALSQNYPNPFQSVTSVVYTLRRSGRASLRVYDLYGREVMTLENSFQQPGEYTVPIEGAGLPGGTYVCRLESGGAVLSRVMTLVK